MVEGGTAHLGDYYDAISNQLQGLPYEGISRVTPPSSSADYQLTACHRVYRGDSVEANRQTLFTNFACNYKCHVSVVIMY